MPGPLGLGAVVVVPVAGDDAVVCAKYAGPIKIPVSKTASIREMFMGRFFQSFPRNVKLLEDVETVVPTPCPSS